jgi:hypothetical protein
MADSDTTSEAVNGVVLTLTKQGLDAAKRGHDRLSAFWAELTPDERLAVGGQDALMLWKMIAARAPWKG